MFIRRLTQIYADSAKGANPEWIVNPVILSKRL